VISGGLSEIVVHLSMICDNEIELLWRQLHLSEPYTWLKQDFMLKNVIHMASNELAIVMVINV